MACESWKAKLETYVDGELPDQEMRGFDAHVRSCPTCSPDALARVQMKRTIHVAGKRFTPSAEFRKRIKKSMASNHQHRLGVSWMLAGAPPGMLGRGPS